MITSRQNGQVKTWIKLNRKKEREKTGLFIAEGFHLVEEAIKSQMSIKELIISEKLNNDLPNYTNGYPQTVISDELSNEIADTETPQGIFAVVEMPKQSNQLHSKVLLLDQVQDPGNLGTIIRSADAAGFTQVICGEGTVDPYNAKVLRSGQGSHFHVDIQSADLNEYISKLKRQSIPVYGTDLSKDSIDYKTVGPKDKVAIIVGNEGSGVNKELLELVDGTLHVPMKGQAESLNVAVAASILMFHLSN